MPSFEHLHLHTERLSLRPLRADDAQAMFELFSDTEVVRYWGAPWTGIEAAHDFIAQETAAMHGGKHIRLAIELKEGGQFIGVCNLFNIVAQSRRAEVGYCLARKAWRQGYISEALTALLGHAFSDMELNRIEADIDPRNEASAKSLERLGFTREGYLPERWIVNGASSDSVLYGQLRSRWLARP